MTRFEMDLMGRFGDYWKNDAEKQIAKMQESANNGEILTDDNGGAYWKSSGHYLPEDCAVILTHTSFDFNLEETNRGRKAQNEKILDNYRKTHKTTDEERIEAHNAFGNGTHIVNIITGERI